MSAKSTSCEEGTKSLKICYVAVSLFVSVITVVAVSTNHWVQMVEGRPVADIVASMDDDQGAGYTSYEEVDCANEKLCPFLDDVEDDADQTSHATIPSVLYIYSSLGLWKICYRTEILPTRCVGIDYMKQSWGSVRGHDGEITIYIARGVRRSSFTALLSVISLLAGSILAVVGVMSTKPALTISAIVLKMAAAMFLLLTIIIFLTGIQNEASMAPPGGDEDDQGPSFHYDYGWSFHVLVVSYLGSNTASVLGITLHIQRFRRREHAPADAESSTEGELVFTNDALPEWPIRNEISV